MKSDVQKVSSLERKLNIEVPVDKVNAAFDEAYKQLQKNVEIKGFRKGKAPLPMIKTMYKDRVLPDVAQNLIQSHYSVALDEHQLVPISAPTIDLETAVAEDAALKFTASFEIRPDISEVKYDGLEIYKEKLTITDKMIDETIDNMAKRNAKLEPVLIARPLQKDDFAIIDFEGFDNGTPIAEVKGTDLPVKIGGGQFLPGFEDQLLGMNIGQGKSFDQPIPADYHHKPIAGKTITFKITVKEIKKENFPKIDDEFAKQFEKQTLNELKDAIREEMKAGETERINEEFKKRALTALTEKNPVDIPKTLQDEQRNRLVEDFKRRMMSQGMSEADYTQYEKDWSADFDKTAKFLVHSYFLVDKLAKDNNMKTSADEINKKIEEYAVGSGIDINRLKQYYNEPEMRSRLSYQIAESKVISLIETKAKIKEVEKEKLPKID